MNRSSNGENADRQRIAAEKGELLPFYTKELAKELPKQPENRKLTPSKKAKRRAD